MKRSHGKFLAANAAFLASAFLAAAAPVFAATENADERRDARDVKQDTRKDARVEKVDCKRADQKNNAQCRQDKRDTKQEGRDESRDVRTGK